MTYPTRKIGDTPVSTIGFGAMGISVFYGKTESDEERLKVRIGHGNALHIVYHSSGLPGTRCCP